MQYLLEFLSEANGSLSSTRLFMLLIILSVIVDYQHAIWTAGVWHPDWEIISLILGGMGFKVWQKNKETAP